MGSKASLKYLCTPSNLRQGSNRIIFISRAWVEKGGGGKSTYSSPRLSPLIYISLPQRQATEWRRVLNIRELFKSQLPAPPEQSMDGLC